MAETKSRPLSPHLTVWRWGPHMLVSILHRVTGGALAIVGLALLIWWLSALSGRTSAYADFTGFTKHWIGLVVLVGISWAFFQHMLSGIRHLFTDAGQGFELDVNKGSALATLICSAGLTVVLWGYIFGAMQ